METFFASVLCLVWTVLAIAKTSPATRPNVLVIIVDDLGIPKTAAKICRCATTSGASLRGEFGFHLLQHIRVSFRQVWSVLTR